MLLAHQYQDGFYCTAVGPHAFASPGSEKFLSLNIKIELTGPYAVRENGRLFDPTEIHKFLTENYGYSTLPPALLVVDIARELAAKMNAETDADGDPRVNLLSKIEIQLTLGDITTHFMWNESWDNKSQLLDPPRAAFFGLEWVRLLEIEEAKRAGMRKGSIVIAGSKLASAKVGDPLPWDAKPGTVESIDITGWYLASIARAVAEITGAEVGSAKWASVARNYLRLSHKDLGAPSTYIIGDMVVDARERAIVRAVSADEFSAKATGWYVADSRSFEETLGLKLKDKLEFPADKAKAIEAARSHGLDYGNRLAYRRYNDNLRLEHDSADAKSKSLYSQAYASTSTSTSASAASAAPKHTGCGK